MAFLKGKKVDLFTLAEELGLQVSAEDKVLDLRDKIVNSQIFKDDVDFVQGTFENIVQERKTAEENQRLADENQRLANEREFELEKLRIEAGKRDVVANTSNLLESSSVRVDLKKVLPEFNPEKDDMNLFLVTFERQMKLLKVSKDLWVTYLVGALPSEIGKLIAREPEEKFQDYFHIRDILLQRFKLTAERFRVLFSRHKKRTDCSWKEFYFEIRSYFEGWISELKINTFEKLSELIIAEQLKKKSSPECKEHYLDQWESLTNPVELADKLDLYDNLRTPKVGIKTVNKFSEARDSFRPGKMTQEYKGNGLGNISNPYDSKRNKATYSSNVNGVNKHVTKNENRPTLSCYGCGKQGFIKSKCPSCSPVNEERSAHFNSLQFRSCSVQAPQTLLLKIKINGITGTACADTGATHCIAGEQLYSLLRDQGINFEKTNMTIVLADGLENKNELYKTEVTVTIEGRDISITLFALPSAKDNRTILGIDFLHKAGIILDIVNRQWFFTDRFRSKYKFAEDTFRPPSELAVKSVDFNSVFLREDEGKHLTSKQRMELNELLGKFTNIFQLGEEATPKVKHYIDTGAHPPVAVPPYRMSPVKKELLRKELDDLLSKGIIEECESPYAAPVVLVPKPNGKMRLCIDYRKLNAITKTDNYPVPRIDDLLHEAKHTSYMTTIDLKSGYHQIEVNAADRDKTAFICPFGTFRYIRMPFGLKNAPRTFQRLMDNFRGSLEDIFVLSYLDDIIILSENFQKHLSDLEAIFTKLCEFRLYANREKCNFTCDRVKYLGHYITRSGLEVDPEKTAAVQKMPPPRNVKQVQSFLQTCSWYRRFIPKFSEVARPLSNLTKKNIKWNWSAEEESSFQALKELLISPPILAQNDPSKPYILRTDASNYALGAVLLQGSGAEEHPIEYASRLLTKTEKNYSTTEREALAVIWALNKFRAYIDGQEVIVSTDHQPLKWLMSLKSPTGRLARWALQVQSFNLKIDYIPGKTNVVADMLSRPFCQHEDEKCEICSITVNMPSRSAREIREEQLRDEEIKKIIETFENPTKDENYANWTERGYLMNQGVLYRYAPESESEEAQLVVPAQEREKILKEYHDAPTAGHYGIEGTFNRIAKRYFWTGMRRYIAEYIKNCKECCRYKPSNQKPSGLLQTPIYGQRFETLSVDLFGPLPKSNDGKRWIFIVEDCTTKWVELFALARATAKECAITLIEEVFLRYGFPRQIISDNGPQFISSVMQQVCFFLKIDQSLTPVYHPQANPVERKNRDLKPRLAILVGDDHTTWNEKLPNIRFALNTAQCSSTGLTAAYFMFGREPRTTDDVAHDLRSIIANDNFIPEITPYLKTFAKITTQIKDRIEQKQDKHKYYADKHLKRSKQYNPGDRVWVTLHPLSNAKSKRTAKFMPRRDGPYIILKQRSPTSYTIATEENPFSPLGNYHVSALSPWTQDDVIGSKLQIQGRGRPKKLSQREPLRKNPPRSCTLYQGSYNTG